MQVGDPPVGGRYSLVAPYGGDERFAGGKVQTWRARDTVAERDVILRVITPGGNSSRLFLDRALEMNLVAHPGLGAVYEAVDHGEYAIVVCEWIDGTSLADTLAAHGPLNPAIARQTIADVADAITEAHHAGLPIGGITAERVVLRDNAVVTVSAVPALFADERGDIQQLGILLYAALTGKAPELDDPDLAKHLDRRVPRDLAVLCQRALDQDPARQLGSAAAFAAVLRPRRKPPSPSGETAGRTGDRLGGLDPEPTPAAHDTSPARLPQPAQAPLPTGPATDPPTVPVRLVATPPAQAPSGPSVPSAPPAPKAGEKRESHDRSPSRHGAEDAAIFPLGRLTDDDASDDYDPWQDEDTGTWGSYDDDTETGRSQGGSQTQRKVLLYAVPLVALILVILLGVFVGKQFSAVVSDNEDSPLVPSSEAPASDTPPVESEATETTEAPGAPVPLAPVSAAVYDPFGDGEPENTEDVGLSYDGDPASAWETLTYQNTPEFGNLKPGVGVIFDLGEERTVNTVELATTLPGSAIEIRTGAAPDAALDSYPVVGTLDPFSETGSVALAEPVRARFVIVWFVRLVDSNGGFRGALAECRILGS